MGKKYRTDEDINHKMTSHWRNTVVRIKTIDVRSHDDTAGNRVHMAIFHMKPTVKSNAGAKAVLRSIAWKKTLPARFCCELSLIFRRLECEGIRFVPVTASVERRVCCWRDSRYARHVLLKRIYDGIASCGLWMRQLILLINQAKNPAQGVLF